MNLIRNRSKICYMQIFIMYINNTLGFWIPNKTKYIKKKQFIDDIINNVRMKWDEQLTTGTHLKSIAHTKKILNNITHYSWTSIKYTASSSHFFQTSIFLRDTQSQRSHRHGLVEVSLGFNFWIFILHYCVHRGENYQ